MSSAKVFTPIAYLQGVNPGGLALSGGHAYIADRGWPAQAEVGLPNGPEMTSEPVDTRGGLIYKVELASGKLVEDGNNWPSPAVYNQVTGSSEKPYLGPVVKGTDVYVLANAFREVAPEVRMSTDTRGGSLFRAVLDGAGKLGPPARVTGGALHGPGGLAVAAGGKLYVTNRRATGNEPKLVRLNANLGTDASIGLSGASPREPGALLYRQESGNDVLYVVDLADDPAAQRGSDPGASQRGRVLRVEIAGGTGTAGSVTVLADDLDRPIALAERPSSDPNHPFELFVLCAWPRQRAEVVVKHPNASPAAHCLPPWATWSRPFGNIRRIKAPADLTQQAPLADVTLFTPALHAPGGIAVDGDTLYVVTQAGAPAVPTDPGQAGVTGACHDAQPSYDPLWTWRQPPSAVLYAVSLI
jgi:hypothetical protein